MINMELKPTNLSPSNNGAANCTEYRVRVLKNVPKKFSLMKFGNGMKIDFNEWQSKLVRLERDLSRRRLIEEDNSPQFGAGSVFGKKEKEEARKKKLGYRLSTFREDDQPWDLKLGSGKSCKRFTGKKEGGVSDNSTYYVFTQCSDRVFEAYPINSWYSFTPTIRHRVLDEEEAEEEFSRRNKILNYNSLMIHKRLQDKDEAKEKEEAASDEKKNLKKAKQSFKISDTDEWAEISSGEDDDDESDDDGKSQKKKKKTNSKKSKKTDRNETIDGGEDFSDDGDMEGEEIDYMSSDSSPSENEDQLSNSKLVPKGINEARGSDADSEEDEMEEDGEKNKTAEDTKPEEEKDETARQKNDTETEGGKKAEESSDSDSTSSSESDIDENFQSALFVAGRKPSSKQPTPKTQRDSKEGSKETSRSITPTNESSSTATAILTEAADRLSEAQRLDSLKRKGDSDQIMTLAKKPRSDSPTVSGNATPNSGDQASISEEAVRRYLMRKPLTTKDLLQKFKSRRTGLSNEETVKTIALILKRIQPQKEQRNGKLYLYLKKTPGST